MRFIPNNGERCRPMDFFEQEFLYKQKFMSWYFL